jgi:hypothetical protein
MYVTSTRLQRITHSLTADRRHAKGLNETRHFNATAKCTVNFPVLLFDE